MRKSLDEKIEEGRQLGIIKEVCSEGKNLIYFYAVQKVRGTYYVYECETDEAKMSMDEDEYEYVNQYNSIDEVKKSFPRKYGTAFEDITTQKGQKIFNVNLYTK